jgi:ADP-ribose pyrophosphatase
MITARKRSPLSPWVTLVEKEVEQPSGKRATFHSLEVADYVAVCARTASGTIPIVRQFRPAVEVATWEFPGGLVEPPESPQTAAVRELREEAGLAAREVLSLGHYWSDTGRLSNRTHAFFVDANEPGRDFVEEPGVQCRFVTVGELSGLIAEGEFAHGLHIAVYLLARDKRGF